MGNTLFSLARMFGLFIVLEGPDGSGTTKHAALLADRLCKNGTKVLLTREPTDGVHGKKVRASLTSHEPFAPEDIQKLFCLDRADHVEKIILPALEAGNIVISDRFSPSTLIYGEVAGVPRDLLEKWNAPFPKPDVLLITMPPVDICLERLRRREERDVFEKDDCVRRVYEGYQKYAEDHPEAIVIDTSGSKEETAEHIWQLVGGVASSPLPPLLPSENV
jgi:dTMP kinase